MLTAHLLRGALLSPLKPRPHPDAPLDTTHRTLPAATPDPRHLTAYARLCGYRTEADALLTYPHILGFPLAMRIMSTRAFPLPLIGLVHTSVDIARSRPLHTTEPLEIDVHAAKLSPHRRGTEATLVTEARDADGTTVWASSSTYLARHKTSSNNSETAPRPAKTPDPLPALADWPLPADLGRRYAAVSGDRNPIHLHPLTARALGFPRTIAHGMWTVARCLAEQEADAEGALHVHAEFKAPVMLPGTVTYAATPDGEAFQLRGAKGELHLTGSVSQRLPARG
ncbi:MaoC family dehydratase [Streptomyces sp. NPDC050658]|uniref:MaoC family dehydratase n=1 Tax=unclassified Streptomyces TaxID=2593676 RepID=UPI003418472F